MSRIEYLRQLPTLTLLDRMPTPMIAVGVDGLLVYTNPACAEMLGHTDATALTALPLPSLMANHATTTPPDCATALRSADGAVTVWNHADGSLVHTFVSDSILQSDDDPVLLISITDITELLWTTRPVTSTLQPSSLDLRTS